MTDNHHPSYTQTQQPDTSAKQQSQKSPHEQQLEILMDSGHQSTNNVNHQIPNQNQLC